MAEHKKHAGHGIKSSHITHHHDGSHTMEQHHEDGSMTSSAKGDLDQVHDHLENTIGTPNPVYLTWGGFSTDSDLSGTSLFLPINNNSSTAPSPYSSPYSTNAYSYIWVYVTAKSNYAYILYVQNGSLYADYVGTNIDTWILNKIMNINSNSSTSIFSIAQAIEQYAWFLDNNGVSSPLSSTSAYPFLLKTLGNSLSSTSLSSSTVSPSSYYVLQWISTAITGNSQISLVSMGSPMYNSSTTSASPSPSTTYSTQLQCRFLTNSSGLNYQYLFNSIPSNNASPDVVVKPTNTAPSTSPTLLSTFGSPTSTTSTFNPANQTVLTINAITATGFTLVNPNVTVTIMNDNGSTFNFTTPDSSGTGSYTANSITLNSTGINITWIKNYQLQKTWTASGATANGAPTAAPPLVLGLSGSATFVMVNTSTGAIGTYMYTSPTSTQVQIMATDITGINPVSIDTGTNNILVTSTIVTVRILGYRGGITFS